MTRYTGNRFVFTEQGIAGGIVIEGFLRKVGKFIPALNRMAIFALRSHGAIMRVIVTIQAATKFQIGVPDYCFIIGERNGLMAAFAGNVDMFAQ